MYLVGKKSGTDWVSEDISLQASTTLSMASTVTTSGVEDVKEKELSCQIDSTVTTAGVEDAEEKELPPHVDSTVTTSGVEDAKEKELSPLVDSVATTQVEDSKEKELLSHEEKELSSHEENEHHDNHKHKHHHHHRHKGHRHNDPKEQESEKHEEHKNDEQDNDKDKKHHHHKHKHGHHHHNHKNEEGKEQQYDESEEKPVSDKEKKHHHHKHDHGHHHHKHKSDEDKAHQNDVKEENHNENDKKHGHHKHKHGHHHHRHECKEHSKHENEDSHVHTHGDNKVAEKRTSGDVSYIGTDNKLYHSHDGLAPHTHEPIYSPGFFAQRAKPLNDRDYSERSFTVGIGGPVGTGKTALMLALCRELRDSYSLAAVTNDIFTREDGEFLIKNGALPPERIRAVETGGCPHAAIREDISINLGPLEELSHKFKTELLLCESGGDNLAANFSRELADYIIYIIDVAGGDKIPRKGGPGITQADLLVINKTDLAEAVGADLSVMERDALKMRDGGPFVFAQVKHGKGVKEIANHVLDAWEKATGMAKKL